MIFSRQNGIYVFLWLNAFLMISQFSPVYGQSTTGLFIPGFDPQPVSADIIGIGSDGHTTWAIHQGQRTPGDTSSYEDFGTATLVQGPSDAYLTYVNSAAKVTLAESCTVSDSTLAICAVFGQGLSGTQTEVYTPIPVQIGLTLTGSVTILPVTTTAPGSTSASTSGSISGRSTGSSIPASTSVSSTSQQTATLPSATNQATNNAISKVLGSSIIFVVVVSLL
ncbi:hypothetical protein CPB83DRAFT_806489 [Crepidotus variabilis]|uniref:Uncharacterized protein n=1 Tax=Crepidotus variabilis TaxID=179855 RepID=A0A9P6EP95_9AGAR|nr:hypothetical protein CPB83DRAFT_806489 [Crepidotus variabilis]